MYKDKDEIKPFPGKGFEPCPEDKGWLPLDVPTELNVETVRLVRNFASAMMEKLLEAQRKYGYTDNWMRSDWMDECRAQLREHTEKGDPRDVAAYCAFLWYHGEPTAKPVTENIYV